MSASASRKATTPRALGVMEVIGRARVLSCLCAGLVLCGCGVGRRGAQPAHGTATAFPDVKISSRPCAVQAISLLTASEMLPGVTPQGPATLETGPRALLGNATDGSVGSAFQYFQPAGKSASTASSRAQIIQIAEGIVDYGTVATAQRWLSGQEASHRPNDSPMFGDGVERTPQAPALGNDTFIYQIDIGAPYTSHKYDGPYIGRVDTNVQVRDGDLIYAIDIISVPDTGMAPLAISFTRALIAKEQAVCG